MYFSAFFFLPSGVNICLLNILAGFFVTIWIAAFMYKSNDILRKQTALKVCYDIL